MIYAAYICCDQKYLFNDQARYLVHGYVTKHFCNLFLSFNVYNYINCVIFVCMYSVIVAIAVWYDYNIYSCRMVAVCD